MGVRACIKYLHQSEYTNKRISTENVSWHQRQECQQSTVTDCTMDTDMKRVR